MNILQEEGVCDQRKHQRRYCRTITIISRKKRLFIQIELAYHNWFVGLVLEVSVPKFVEFGTHFFELFFRGPDLGNFNICGSITQASHLP